MMLFNMHVWLHHGELQRGSRAERLIERTTQIWSKKSCRSKLKALRSRVEAALGQNEYDSVMTHHPKM